MSEPSPALPPAAKDYFSGSLGTGAATIDAALDALYERQALEEWLAARYDSVAN